MVLVLRKRERGGHGEVVRDGRERWADGLRRPRRFLYWVGGLLLVVGGGVGGAKGRLSGVGPGRG